MGGEGLTKEQEKKILEFYFNKKYTSTEVAKELNISGTSVFRIIKRNGLKPRTNKDYSRTEETKRKISNTLKGYQKGMPYEERYGIERAKEIRRKQSENNAKIWLGISPSKEVRQKISIANTGKKRSKKSKERYSKYRMGKTWEELYGKEKAEIAKKRLSKALKKRPSTFLGRKHKKESLEKIGKASKERMKGEMLQKAKRTLLKGIEIQMKNGFVSKPEKQMKEWLQDLAPDFIHGKRLGWIGVPDFHSPERKIIVEVDGVYWHSKPEAIKKDKEKNIYWDKIGYNVFRFSDIEIMKQGKKTLQTLNNILGVNPIK